MNTASNSPARSSENQFGFWGNLPLGRKLLLAFGSLFVFALIITAFALWGLNRVETGYETGLATGVQIRYISSHIHGDLLNARRQEKNFLLRWKAEGWDTAYTNYVTLLEESLKEMREHIIILAPFGNEAATVSTGNTTQAEYDSDIALLSQDVDAYEQNFLALVDALKQRGGNENTGLELDMRNAIHDFEAQITGVDGLEQMEITMLQMRRHEKDYLARGAQEYIDGLHTSGAELAAMITGSSLLTTSQKNSLKTDLENYQKSFDAIVAVDLQIAAYNESMIAAGRSIEPITDRLALLGEQLAADDITRAHTASTQTFNVSIVIALVALGLSIFLSIFLSQQITSPVTQLTKTAGDISEGNFDSKAVVSSGDEVGTLAQTFNLMTDRLSQAFADVRRRALAVQTSAEVSRRLSTATNARQLAYDVVEQVQAAFHYYHAHIYFVDDVTGDLVMAGGTGDAGAAMLARGHRIPKGRGLVGRAAGTNAPVLVPDVTKAEGWLPNPLLPDTKSETAIPISAGDQVLGVLDVQQNMVNGLGEEDVELLTSLAGQVAISYINARTFQESQAQAEFESMVNAIGQKIQRASSVEETLQTAIRELGIALGASRVKANISARSNGAEAAFAGQTAAPQTTSSEVPFEVSRES